METIDSHVTPVLYIVLINSTIDNCMSFSLSVELLLTDTAAHNIIQQIVFPVSNVQLTTANFSLSWQLENV